MVSEELEAHSTPDKKEYAEAQADDSKANAPGYGKTFRTPEQAAATRAGQEAEKKRYADEMQRRREQEHDQAKIERRATPAEERMNMFRVQVGPLVRSLTAEQRVILRRTLDEVEEISNLPVSIPLAGDPLPVVTSQPGDPHAQLKANKAAKIASAEQGVSLLARAVQTPILNRVWEPGEVQWQDPEKTSAIIDGVHYQKVGEQWQVNLGHAGGHPQARWLSKKEAITVGLEPDDTAKEPHGFGAPPPDLNQGEHAWEPGLREGLDWQPAAPHAGAQPVEKPQGDAGGINERIDQQGKQG